MKKHLFIISSIFILSTIINVSALNDISSLEKTNKPVVTEKELQQYILKDYNGRIALFVSENETPIEVFEIFTTSLPQQDAALIKKGIHVTTEELKNILEEYTS